jgi:hypothetical protein
MSNRKWRAPAAGDSVLVFQRRWLDLVLAGEKTMEVRPFRLKPTGRYYLGSRGRVYAMASFGSPTLVVDPAEWKALADQHLVRDQAEPPYDKRTYVHEILQVVRAPPGGVPYVHPRGAISVFRWRA